MLLAGGNAPNAAGTSRVSTPAILLGTCSRLTVSMEGPAAPTSATSDRGVSVRVLCVRPGLASVDIPGSPSVAALQQGFLLKQRFWDSCGCLQILVIFTFLFATNGLISLLPSQRSVSERVMEVPAGGPQLPHPLRQLS